MIRLTRVAPELPVSDMKAALMFYQQKLGFSIASEYSGEYAVVARDDIAIHLFCDGTEQHTPVGLHIFTQQLDELLEEFRRRGACLSQEIMPKAWGTRDFRVNDDWGNQLKFTAPVLEHG